MSGLAVQAVSAADWPGRSAAFRDLGFEQSGSYAAAAARRIGAVLRFYEVTRDGHPLAAAAVRIKTVPGLGRGIAWIASGPLVLPGEGGEPDEATLAAILAAMRAELAGRQGHVLRLRLSGTAFLPPATVATAARLAGFHPTTRAPLYRSHVVPLDCSDDVLMAGLHGKWRGHLRAALKAGLTLDRGTGPDHEARFLTLFDRVQDTKGFRLPDILPQFHFALEGPDYDLEVLIAQRDGADVAGIVIGGSGATCVYLFGATDILGRQHRAGYFLAWNGFVRAREKGFGWYDMGGADAEENPAVAEFKERTGGVPVLAEAHEAVPPGPGGHLILQLERLRARLKGRG